MTREPVSRPPPVALRPYLPGDAPARAEIFRDAIEQLTGEDYDPSQQEAWASIADDADAFAGRLAKTLTLVATEEGEVVGFASLEKNETIDMLYVAPDMAGRGVATTLADALERLAAARGTRKVSAQVSDTALPFFMGRGFEPQQRNAVQRAGQWLSNTTMIKTLQPPPGGEETSR